MSTTAKLVGYTFIHKDYPEEIRPIFDSSPEYGHLSPERWERRPVYVLDPDPVLTVDIAKAAA